MLIHAVLGIAAILATWIFLGCVCVGMGAWFGWGWRRGREGVEVVLEMFWVGVGTVLGVLQIWHFLGAMDGVVQAVVMAAGVFGFVLVGRRVWGAVRGISRREVVGSLVVLGVVVVWVANRCTGPGAEYDSGLYHIAAEKWSRLYAVVPGLANLHMRFGFSSTVTLFSAWLDHGLWAGEANHFVNGFFLAGLAVMVVRSGARVWVGQGVAADWLLVFCGVLVVDWGVDIQAGSFSTDIGSVVLAVVAGHYLLRAFAERDDGAGLAAVVVGAAAITAKASALVLCGPMVVMVLGWMAWGRRWRALGMGVVAAGILMGAWVGRQVILSGYPLYPLEFLSVAVDWRVPFEKVRWLRGIMLNWARWSSYAETRGQWGWVGTWLVSRVLNRWTIWRFFVPGGVGVVALLVAAVRLVKGKSLKGKSLKGEEMWGVAGLFLCTVVAGVGWFFSAPDPRYSSQIFVMMMGCALILAVGAGIECGERFRKGVVIAAAVFALGPLVYGCHEAQRYTGRTVAGVWILPPVGGVFYATPEGRYRAVRTGAGLVVYVPEAAEGETFEDRMWDGPLPNAPLSEVEVKEVAIGELRLREVGNVQGGFTRKP